MVKSAVAMFCILAISHCALGDEPSASGGRVHANSSQVRSENCERRCQPGNPICSDRPSFSLFEEQAEKLAKLRGRSTQLPQHIAYASPMEDSYFFRPYSVAEIAKQQRAGRDPKNPYDNRFLQSIYKQLDLESGN